MTPTIDIADVERIMANDLQDAKTLASDFQYSLQWPSRAVTMKADTSGGTAACWPWKGYVSAQGYGMVAFNGMSRPAHRVAYLWATGFWAPLGGRKHVIRHLCHNPVCCNPKHLLIGTYSDNKRDERMRQLGIDLVAVRLRVEAWGRVPVGDAA